MKQAVIYCRVSTKKQENHGDSLANQEESCRRFCENNNIKVIKTFKESFTGKERNRPVLNDAIEYAISNKLTHFIIFDIDRLSREGYGRYTELKELLFNNDILLKDSKNIIGDNRIVIANDIIDMGQYQWNLENSGEYAEAMVSMQAQIEGKKIIQRTIPREIQLEQQGYQVRSSNFGYTNKKIKLSDGKKVTIQEEHPTEGKWVIEIFIQRAKGIKSDREIVEYVNTLGCKKRRIDKPMDVKYMQELIKNPIYAGVLKTKWTGERPIKTAYPGLVSIDTWNKANKSKVKILENSDGSLGILYGTKDECPTLVENKQKRKNYNPMFPYAKVIRCPYCNGDLTGNKSKGRNGYHFYYQCKGKKGKKHKNYSLKQKEVNSLVINFFRNINICKNIIELFKEISREVYHDRKKEIINDKELINIRIKGLKDQEELISNNITNIIHLPILLEKQNKKLEGLNSEIKKLELELEKAIDLIDIDKFIRSSIQIITHLDRLAIQKENPQLINLAFDIMFGDKVLFDEINNHTTFMQGLAGLLSHQKNPQKEDLVVNRKWQAHEESNLERRIWSPEL